ncbi:hypothetical protein F4782DRAFT_548056 [Xylaria castorea]|nr:hypothetical protein F4782DRAFT_548056 [Xylaria castorea]
MNNFGVIELASTRTTNAPGWAYVPDRQQQHHHLAAAPTSTSNRKRARAAAGGAPLSLADASARQEAKARREIEILDRDNARDVQIAVPPKPGGSGGGISRTGGKKYTPNVRKILQSQKTFANHLDDYVALLSQQDANPNNNNNTTNNGGGGATPASGNAHAGGAETAAATTTTTKRSGQRQASAFASAAAASTSSRKPAAKQEPEDVQMLDVPDTDTSSSQEQPRSTILTLHPLPPTRLGDDDPLLASRLPPLPSDEELRALLAAPPLSYLEARGTWPPNTGGDGRQYPTRAFCVVCGYWGRVRCMKCGTRVCALECLETHQEECVTRYGL